MKMIKTIEDTVNFHVKTALDHFKYDKWDLAASSLIAAVLDHILVAIKPYVTKSLVSQLGNRGIYYHSIDDMFSLKKKRVIRKKRKK